MGDDVVVGIRFVIDEGIEDGSDFEDCLNLARLFEQEGHLDYFELHLRTDGYGPRPRRGQHAGHLPAQRAFPRAGLAVSEGNKASPASCAGIRDVATARHAIRAGAVDLVGRRRRIADPHIVNKIMRGEEERIRPCVGASYCLYKKVNCIHNAASGRETTLSHVVMPAAQRSRVVVIGGGPAGMEAARVSAERGHSVILFEAGPRLGGQIIVAASARERRDLIGIVDWRVSELERLGVEVRTNSYAEDALAKSLKSSSLRRAASPIWNGWRAPSCATVYGTS